MRRTEPDCGREYPSRVEYVEGVVKLSDGLILIHDLDKFLSLEEESSLDQALENRMLETS